jgi:hypothetical protein
MAGHSLDDPPPLAAVPELVIEIVSGSDTRLVPGGKIADFCALVSTSAGSCGLRTKQ